MDAAQYISFFKGNKEKAIATLERYIFLYEKSTLKQTLKGVKRIKHYKNLLIQIKQTNENNQNQRIKNQQFQRN